ncbi:MAG: DinB family protein [Saprospiraceae bacterium]
MDKFKTEFIENAIYRINENTRMIKKTFEELSEADIWRKPNDSSNSIGNLILHLCGNIGQYIIASLGENPDTRERDLEFSTTDVLTTEVSGRAKAELLQQLIKTVETAKSTIENATTEQLLNKRMVQGFEFSGIGVVIHAVEHYSYHTGQIAFWTKILKDKDLGFYDGLDLNVIHK